MFLLAAAEVVGEWIVGRSKAMARAAHARSRNTPRRVLGPGSRGLDGLLNPASTPGGSLAPSSVRLARQLFTDTAVAAGTGSGAGTGTLDRRAIAVLFRQLDFALSDVVLDDILSEMDPNSDGVVDLE